MAEAMEALNQKKNSNYNRVISRLRKPDKFNEAHSVLETGTNFCGLGLRSFLILALPLIEKTVALM
jgi:hypothetical protein